MLDGSMATSFQKLYHIPLLANSHYRATYRTAMHPNLVVKVFPVALPTEESKNPPDSGKFRRSSTDVTRCQIPAMISQEHTVGVIGGFSAFSTLMFLEKLVWWGSRDGEDCVPFIVCSDPAINRVISDHGNLAKVGDAQTELYCAAVVDNLKHKRVYLEQSGARCIAMPCHLSHVWHREVSEGCSADFLNVGDCVANELKEAKLKPLEAGRNVRLGVLAADPALMADFYQEKLKDQSYEVELPDKSIMEHMVVPALEALKKRDTKGARNLLRIAIQALLVKGVNKIILASDEFQGLLPCNDPLLRKCIDPMDALARSTIKWAKSSATPQINFNGT